MRQTALASRVATLVAATLVSTLSASPQASATPATPAPAAPTVVANTATTTAAPVTTIAAVSPDRAAVAAAADPSAVPTDPTAVARAAVVQIALGKVGRPYRYGAAGPHAFDCSGLVQWSYRQVGVSLPHSSRAQSRIGTPVSRAALQPGDLVFFYRPVSHVAIYIGGGKIVHASTSGSPVKVSDLAGSSFNSARRI